MITTGLRLGIFARFPSVDPNLWYTVAALAEGGRPLDAVAKQISRAGVVALVATQREVAHLLSPLRTWEVSQASLRNG